MQKRLGGAACTVGHARCGVRSGWTVLVARPWAAGAATPLFGESARFPRPDTENSPEQMNRFCRKATWYFMLFPVAQVCPLLGVVGLPRTCRRQAFVRHTSCQATRPQWHAWGGGQDPEQPRPPGCAHLRLRCCCSETLTASHGRGEPTDQWKPLIVSSE